MRGRRSTIIAVSLSLVVLVGVVLLAPHLYDRLRRGSAEAGRAPLQGEVFQPLAHDDVLGRPLSFETPAHIRIPAVEIDEEVREGSDDEEELYALLALGPVHLTHTGFPGWPGNCVISGHRTTRTRPFNRLDELRPGDVIYIHNPRGTHAYAVSELRYIDPGENVTLQTIAPVLTLTTCAPEGLATLRLVVRAELKESAPAQVAE